MPSAEDPKRSVRLAPEDLAMLESASQRANVAVGALIRECVRRSASAVAADASAGRVTLRRRSASVPVPAPAAIPSPGERQFERGPGNRAVPVAPEPSEAKRYVDGLRDQYAVKTGRELAMERQRKLNERKS